MATGTYFSTLMNPFTNPDVTVAASPTATVNATVNGPVLSPGETFTSQIAIAGFPVSATIQYQGLVTVAAEGGGTTSGFYGTVVGGLANGQTVLFTTGNPEAGVVPNFSSGDFTVCFMPGTLIATPQGDRAIEELAIGDEILTADGRTVSVRWIGRQTIAARFANPERALPIRIRAGALGDGLPVRDLLVSPAHAILVDGVLAQAGALVNGTTIRREDDVPEVFTYYNIELAEHDLILAEGAAAETFVDNVSRATFDNGAEHAALYGDVTIPEMDLPRATAHRQIPAATRQRLAAIAAGMGEGTAAAA
ncbi:Hint domain-containing protein [Roseomonas sp. CECT 9278]|uniref:Hint domain-containing protein n=1 Tax=Roseomonas sp. CECT 9278 TaxID=2845823 RepID=UPI001E428E63|nr:Hint domain-containing protein [Roseomonas sp. CECT 9278]CAH0193480.1 hypothetical protein ROS9278_01744 [Roseomonas sp. CECT 9278]